MNIATNAATAIKPKKNANAKPQDSEIGQTNKTEMKKPRIAVSANELESGATRKPDRWWCLRAIRSREGLLAFIPCR